MIVKGIETNLDGAALIKALLNHEFNYNPVCSCGVSQTKDGLKSQIRVAKSKGTGIDHDFICATCRKSRSCTVFGVTYRSVKEAAEASYDVEKCVCEKCGKPLTKDQWYQWCQRYLKENEGHITCHSCISSQVRIELNERDHDLLSEKTRNMNLENWKNPEYREKKAIQQSEVSKRLWNSSVRKYGTDGSKTFSEMRSDLMTSQWNDTEAKFGDNGDQTFTEYISSLKADDWQNPEFWLTVFTGRSPYKFDPTLSQEDIFRKTIKQITQLYLDYSLRYDTRQFHMDSSDDVIDLMITKLTNLGIKHDTYINYISTLSIGNGNHHVIPRSIFLDDFLTVKVTRTEHLLAHFLLLLDNLNSLNNANLRDDLPPSLTSEQMKIFLALAFVAGSSRKHSENPTLIKDLYTILT